MILCKVYYAGTQCRQYLINANTPQEAEKITSEYNKTQAKRGEWTIFSPRDKVTFEPVEFADGIMEL